MNQAESSREVRPFPDREELRQRIEIRIKTLERIAGYGLWAMVLFLLVSLSAFYEFSIFPALGPEVRQLLGTPPPATMISLALVIYAFSSIVRTLARMSHNITPYLGWMHAAFFCAFYLFYHLSGALPDNFWAVFFSGVSVMGLENYHIWAYSSTAIRKERALLESMQVTPKERV